MATPVLTYLNKNKNKIKDLAILITFGGSGYEKTTNNIEKLCGKKAIASLPISRNDRDSSYEHKI
ncbi:MAG: conserved hypothetical protein partial [Methanobrevibacter sp. CfCl-M3]